jgi:hypothetical protein
MEKTFDGKIYGTNDNWGSETFYCNKTEIDKIVSSLKQIDADWKKTTHARDATEYTLVRDLENGTAVYEGEWHHDGYGKNGRYAALVFKHALDGFYQFIEQFDSLPEFEIDQAISQAAATLGRKGGSSTSEAKRSASRNNGAKGGRPKKSA